MNELEEQKARNARLLEQCRMLRDECLRTRGQYAALVSLCIRAGIYVTSREQLLELWCVKSKAEDITPPVLCKKDDGLPERGPPAAMYVELLYRQNRRPEATFELREVEP